MKRWVVILSMIVCSALFAVELPPELPPRGTILTTAAIIEVFDSNQSLLGILLIKRGKEPFGYALPGGKVEYGETVETAVKRELFEETHVNLDDLRQFRVYSDPSRDPLWHSVEVTFMGWTHDAPVAGDDAAEVWVCPLDQIPYHAFAFDHAKILQEYMSTRQQPGKIGLLNPLRRGR